MTEIAFVGAAGIGGGGGLEELADGPVEGAGIHRAVRALPQSSCTEDWL